MSALAYAPYVGRVIAQPAARWLARGAVRAAGTVSAAAQGYKQARTLMSYFPQRKRARIHGPAPAKPNAGTQTRYNSGGYGGGGGRVGGTSGAGYAGTFRGGRRRKAPYRKRSTRRATKGRKRTVRKSVRKSALKGENYFARNGAISTVEVSGLVSDPDCIYVGHASHIPLETLRVTVYALVRRLYFEAIGFEADNMKSTIPYKTTAGAQNSGGHDITVKYVVASTGVKSQSVWNIVDGKSIVDVGDVLLNDLFNVYSNQNDQWKETQLLWIDLTDTATGITRAHLDLTALMVDVYTKSELKMQNVTIPAVGADQEDNVANVPLVGRHYAFKNAYPSLSDDDMQMLNFIDQNNGMCSLRAQQFVGSQYETWKEPPPSKAFTNCKSSAKIRLEPGTIKSSTLITRKRMLFTSLLKAMSIKLAVSGAVRVKFGTSEVLALERLLQKSGDLNIKCNFEKNVFTGASVTVRNKRAIMQKVTFSTYNNNP